MENTTLRLIVNLNIKPGQVGAFKEMARKLAGSVEAAEPNTLSYEWYVNDDEEQCYVAECYPDSDALLSHLGNVGSALGALLEIAPLTEMLVFGSPSEKATEILSGFGARFLPLMAGFTR